MQRVRTPGTKPSSKLSFNLIRRVIFDVHWRILFDRMNKSFKEWNGNRIQWKCKQLQINVKDYDVNDPDVYPLMYLWS